MSRVIENDHRWTDDEVAYQLSRSRDKLVEKNRLDFPGGEDEPEKPKSGGTLQLSPEVFEYVKGLDLAGLREQLIKRELSVDGSEKEMRVRLAQHLQKEKDDSDS